MMNQDQILALIDKSRQHDTTAFALLVCEYQALVFRLAFRLLCNEDEAKDMVQDTFVKVWLSLDKYNDTCRFSTWLYKITCNACYDRLRILQHSPSASPSDIACMDLNIISDENIEQTFVNQELKELILRFMEELTPKQKLVFMLRDVEGLEVDEVKTITGMSAEKIKSNLYQARKQIRMKINQIDSSI